MEESKTKESSKTVSNVSIRERIFTIRENQVMLDSDLAELYHVSTKALNQAVKRNISRFPKEFCFQLTPEEKTELVTNCDRLAKLKHSSVCPYAFSESGVAMLSAVLHSEVAIRTSIAVMNAFVELRHYLTDNALVFQRLERIENKQLEADERIRQLFELLEVSNQGKSVIFFKGQLWDAVSCIEKIIEAADKSIILIDNYIDKGTLDLLSKKKKDAQLKIYTHHNHCNLTEKEIHAFNTQYQKLEVLFTDEFHDRFLILDEKELYHIGASIKDVGKKAFEISLNDDPRILKSILERL